MNKINTFLLLTIAVVTAACHSKTAPTANLETPTDSITITPASYEKTITGIVEDASMNNFMLVTPKADTLFISTMDQDPAAVGGFELGDTVKVNYIEEEEEPGANTIPTAQRVVVIGKKR